MLLRRGEAHARLGRAPVGVDDERVLRQERGRHGHGLVEEPARVAPHVEHEALQLALLVHVLQRLRDVLARAILELPHAHVAVARLDQLRGDALDVDLFARQRERQQAFGILAHDRQRDRGARLAAHQLDGLGERHAAGRAVVDLDDEVARLDARAKRRRVVDRGDDLDGAVLDAHFDAEAAELALRRDLKVLVALGVEEIGMRVEPVDHSVDRFLDELLVGHRLDVVALDPAEHRGQELQILVRDGQLGFALGDDREIERQQHAEHCAQADQTRLFPVVHR